MARASWPALPPPSRGGGGHLAEPFSPSRPSPGPPSYVSGSSGSIRWCGSPRIQVGGGKMDRPFGAQVAEHEA